MNKCSMFRRKKIPPYTVMPVVFRQPSAPREKKVFSYQNSVVLRVLRGYILLKLALMLLASCVKPPDTKPPEGLLYEVVDGKSITITRYNGSEVSPRIPARIYDLPVTVIGHAAFSGCNSLTNVIIPSSVTIIRDYAFASTGLTDVTIPSSVTAIGQEAFATTNLTSVTIPPSVTSIGHGAFTNCVNLANIIVHSKNKAYANVDGVLFDKSGKTLICYPAGKGGAYTIPSSVTAIGRGAFVRCMSLTNVTIPPSVTAIGNSAFAGCKNLTGVTIPPSVTAIDEWAFWNCESLTSVTIPSSVRVIGYGAFVSAGLTSVTLSRHTQLGRDALGSVKRIQYSD